MRGGPDSAAFQRPDERAAYRYMDAMRFFAALAVVMGHARQFVWIPGRDPAEPWSWAFAQMSSLGHPAVLVFFVLSGFWISHSTDRQLASARFWPEFLTARLSRLLLVVVPAIAVGALLDLVGAEVFHGAAYWGGLGLVTLGDGVHAYLTPQVILGNLLFLQSFAVRPVGTNGPLWSIGYEFWFYVWFAALAISVRRRGPSPALLALGLGVIWPVLLYKFPVWLMGSALYYAHRRTVTGPGTGRGRALACFSAGVAAMIAALAIFRLGLVKPVLSDLLVGLAFSLTLWGVLNDALAFPRWLAPFARYGAAASFSLYLTHYPLFAFVLSVIGHDTRRDHDLASFGLIVVLCLLALVVGWPFSRLTEAHTSRLRQSIGLRLRFAPGG